MQAKKAQGEEALWISKMLVCLFVYTYFSIKEVEVEVEVAVQESFSAVLLVPKFYCVEFEFEFEGYCASIICRQASILLRFSVIDV